MAALGLFAAIAVCRLIVLGVRAAGAATILVWDWSTRIGDRHRVFMKERRRLGL